ncbi:MAG: FkbM family methyltransferase [Xenococcaceae cyanobacterium MO_167.B27]|nr:FkbM family methyltransferase [Xenococcaceae cyanobacterium MO_167.B27]
MKEEQYFPYIRQSDLLFDRKLRAKLAKLPINIATKIYSIYSLIHFNRHYVKYKCGKEFTTAYVNKEAIIFPSPIPTLKMFLTACDYKKWLYRKYSYPGFVEVEPDDIVVDCGAFVGGFAMSVIPNAKQIHVFEPSEDNFKCVQRNLGKYENVILVNEGLYNNTTELKFNISSNPVEHSILTPDNQEIKDTVKIKVQSLYDYCQINSIYRIYFCKIEAEGVELEIIEGAKDVDVVKYAIDCSPEQEGKSPLKEIRKILLDRGYEIKRRRYNLFARKV